jgi:FecR protein
MKAKIRVLLVILLTLLCSSYSQAAIKYGEAVIKKGNVVIVRKGRMKLYTQKNNPVAIFENDTIRTLRNSALTLSNQDKNRVTLGANAIMQVKSWNKNKIKGKIRMLFGKFRARTAKLKKKRSLNIRTATATMGIKGSLGDGATNDDFTMLSNRGGNMDITNNGGEISGVPFGQATFNVDGPGGGTQPITGFDPGQSEDEQEGSNLGDLDTEDPKSIEIPPFIQRVITKYVVEVAGIDEGEEIVTDLADGRATPETIDILNDIITDAQTTFQEAAPKVNVNIEIED